MLVIFSKLNVSARHQAWIEAIRKRHDPQQQMVEPHFTFVFPFEGISPGEVVAHAQAVASTASPVSFRLSRAAAVRDLFGSCSHLFLLPDEGEEEMRALHTRLYSGVLASKLHAAATFAPHVTVGAFPHHEDAERAAKSLDVPEIRGVLNAIQIAEFDGIRVDVLREAQFGQR